MERPRSCAAYFCSSTGNWLTSAVTRWLGTIFFSKSNQNSESWVSTWPLLRNAGGQNVVEGRDTVGGHEQQMVGIDPVDVTHFPAGVEFQVGKIGSQNNVGNLS